MERICKDLVIIGGGPGGYELASRASNEGLNVALIEKEKLGGTCLNHGCIPTKSYFQYAKVREQSLKLFGKQLDFDFKDIFESKNQTIATLRQGIEASLTKVQIINEKGSLFKEDDEVLVKTDSYIIEAKDIVIASGSVEIFIPIDGVEYAISSNRLLDLDYLPSSLNIVGGGVIGMEIASIYNALGVKVNVFEYYPSILPRFDKEISRRLTNILKAKGVGIYTSAIVKEIKWDDGEYEVVADVKGSSVAKKAKRVLFATGRMPSYYGLNLNEVGIKYVHEGIKVNKYCQTNYSNIYAIGDVTGGLMLAHKAILDSKVVLNHILGRPYKANYDLIPACCFTLPEVASVGISEDEAKEKGISYKVIKQLYRANGKAQAIKETDGFVKMIVSDDKIIGASIIGEEANLLIHEISTLMNANIKVSSAKSFVHAHPTLSEIIQSCLEC